MNISFVASPLMKYAFSASLDEINGIFIPKILIPSMSQASRFIRIISTKIHVLSTQMNCLNEINMACIVILSNFLQFCIFYLISVKMTTLYRQNLLIC